ncbi:hypothetical protein HPB47_019386 [Ixodes persulcatus]|uniref:Uncharacterized protein n=1 Tax=Ixodes persulcatus TaxID=34615 RepID=A0AC60QKW4_IXOPE|nr:hypothetical protein HPB47_019386 [Ixodes persulcatus]
MEVFSCRRTVVRSTPAACARREKVDAGSSSKLLFARASGARPWCLLLLAPMVTTGDEDRMIVAAAVYDPTLTAKEIRNELGLRVSVSTIRERLHEAGLRSRVPARKPMLSANNRHKRLLFAQEHSSWTVADWQNVVFTDESAFTDALGQASADLASRPDQGSRVASSGRCSVSVWGALSKDGLGPLVRLDGRFNAARYIDVVETVLLPYVMDGPFSDGYFYL